MIFLMCKFQANTTKHLATGIIWTFSWPLGVWEKVLLKKFSNAILKTLEASYCHNNIFPSILGTHHLVSCAKKKIFEQLDFFSKFFWDFIGVRKKLNLEFWKFQGTIKYPHEGILKWFSRNHAKTQSLIFKSKNSKFQKKNFKKFLLPNTSSDQKTNCTLWSKKTDCKWVSRSLSSKFWTADF